MNHLIELVNMFKTVGMFFFGAGLATALFLLIHDRNIGRTAATGADTHEERQAA